MSNETKTDNIQTNEAQTKVEKPAGMSGMKRVLWTFIPLAVFAMLVVLLASGLGRDPRTMPSALIGKPVPEFALPSLLDDEQILTHEMFKGQWTLLNVWATWCPTCYVEHPYFLKLARQGVNIVGVNYKDDLEKAENYLANLGNPYSQVIVDKTGTLAMDLGVYGAPETYVINPEGKILLRHAGEVNERNWQSKFAPVWQQETP